MKIKCEYCESQYEDTLTHCPNCGAPNQIRKEDHQPRTIEELKDWYQKMNLPPYETTRFFLGMDYKKPKAFGIYRDTNGEFVVYKNKADGSRAVRYRGKDEAYAVNEILMKLRTEIAGQKAANRNANVPVNRNVGAQARSSSGSSGKSGFKLGTLIWIIVVVIMILSSLFNRLEHRKDGYYRYNDNVYYNYGSDWFYYDDIIDDWQETYVPSGLDSDQDAYYEGKYYNSSFGGYDWDDSAWYDEYHSSSDDSSYDSDSSWSSSDSWDSGGSDWDSDW